jgi:hypothetical protein
MQTDEKAEELGKTLASITCLPLAVQAESETRVED